MVFPSGQASPEWLGAHCFDTGFSGERVEVESQICRDLFPTTFERKGCACMEISPTGTAMGSAEEESCSEPPAENCTKESESGTGPSNKITRPKFLEDSDS
jgi:hypothetical protein